SSSSSSESEDESDMDDEDDPRRNVVLKFRNYKPFDGGLKDFIVPPKAVVEDQMWIDQEIRDVVESSHNVDEYILNIVPKKVNWDLKRDIAPKLQVLESQTKRAIAELVREKITQERARGD